MSEASREKARTLGEGTDVLFWVLDPAVPTDSYDLGFSTFLVDAIFVFLDQM